MTTVLDVFVIELGLDPKKFTAGQKAAMSSFKQAQEEATSRAKLIEAAGARAAQFFTRLRTEVVGFAALLIGGRGLKDFVAGVVVSNAAVGRLARTMDLAPRELARWRNAFYLGGGSVDGITSSLQSLTGEIQQFQLTGQSSLLPYLYQLGVGFTDNDGKIKTSTQLLLDVADALHRMDPARAAEFGKALHLDNDSINTIIRGRAALSDLLDEADRLNRITDADVAAAERLQRAWRRSELSTQSWGHALLTDLTPGLETGLGWIDKILQKSVELRDTWRGGASFSDRFAPAAGSLRYLPPGSVKPGATGGGDVSLGVLALMKVLESAVPGARFTALNDAYHAGTSSKHASGLALDLTTSGDHAAVASAIRQMLGPGASVLDEYDPRQRSARSTGPHIHVQFSTPEDAARYARGASAGSGGGVTNNRSTSATDVRIGAVNVSVPTARDAADVSRVWRAVDDAMLATPANYGLRP